MNHLIRNLLALAMIVATSCTTLAANNEEEIRQADTISIQSTKMGRSIKTVVIVPEQYADPDMQELQYPVVYLLHGASDCYRAWPQKADLDDIATDFNVIIVCPDGQDSWYFDSPIDPKMQFETFIVSELVDYVDNNYRTFPEAGMRAITGLSMGGHGALWLAFRHPDIFNSCGSMSGGVNICDFPNSWHIKDRLGKYEDNKDVWETHSVLGLVPTLKPGQNIIIDDGTDDIFIKQNNALHDALLKHGIPHDYTVKPGAHTWDYWVNSIDFHMLFFSKCFAKASMKN